jgi:hypothetical protein
MQNNELDYEALATRVRRGDREAGAALQRELEPQLAFIVRRALRGGNNPDPLTQKIRMQAQSLVFGCCHPGNVPPEYLIGQVAKRLSQSVVANLNCVAQPRQWLLETVVGT